MIGSRDFMDDDSVGTVSLLARLPAIPKVPEANWHVNTDFSISSFSKNIHYGSPSMLSKYYHQPGSYAGQDTGYSSDEGSDSEETRLRKKRVRTKRKRMKRKRRKNRARKKKSGSNIVDEQQLARQKQMKDYFSKSNDDTSVVKASNKTRVSFAVNLSPIRRVAMRDKIIKSNLQVFPSSQALSTFSRDRNQRRPAFEIGAKMSRKMSTSKYIQETAAIVIQRAYRSHNFSRRTGAAIAIEKRLREHNWCKEIVRKNLKKMENRYALRIFTTWSDHSKKRGNAKKMALRRLHGFQTKCFDAWKEWVQHEIEQRFEKQAAAIRRILHGKVIRALVAWNNYVLNNKKVSSFRKIWNQRVLHQRLGDWRNAARNSRFANRICKFWKAVQIGILMHNSWLLRNNAAIQIQRRCRGFLGKKRVVVMRRNMYATRIQKCFRGMRGRYKASEEEGAEILREQIRYLHEQHLVHQFLDASKDVLKSHPTRAATRAFAKHLWKMNRRIEYDADRALKKIHVLVESEGEDSSDEDSMSDAHDQQSERSKDKARKQKRVRNRRNITMDDMTNHAYAIFDLVDVNRRGQISEIELEELLGEMGRRNPRLEAAAIDRSMLSTVITNKKVDKNLQKMPVITLVSFLNYYTGQFNAWQRDNSRLVPSLRHSLNYHRSSASRRALKQALGIVIQITATEIFRELKPPKFFDERSGLPFATLKELNVFNRTKQHVNKDGVRGLWNILPMDSKAGIALQWLRSSKTGKVIVSNLIKLVQQVSKNELLQTKVHRSITQNTLEHGKIVLEYYPRGRNIHKFEIELPPVYDHVDLGREKFFEMSNALDPSISRHGHVRFTHGLHNTIQVRSIGTNAVVIARMNKHGALDPKEEVSNGNTVSVDVGDHLWLYRKHENGHGLGKRGGKRGKYMHEFVVKYVERQKIWGAS